MRNLIDTNRLRVTYKRRPSTAPMGRFGGGWQWKLGVQASGEFRTVLISLLIAEVIIARPIR